MKKISVAITVFVLTAVMAVSVSAKTVMLGDANGDGKITASDARAILRFAATLDTYNDEQFVVCDVNSDSKITASDARKVLRVSASIDPELGEITLEEESTDSETPAEPSEAVEVKDGIGMTVANFIKQYGGMTKDGTSDGSTMYHNDNIIIVSDPEMIDDVKISSITVTGSKYMLNGITVDMSVTDARAALASDGWTLKTEDDSQIVYAKHSDFMKLTVRNGELTQIELCLAVSIATEKPTETTTPEPSTNAGTTDEPTTNDDVTNEPTTAPDDKEYLSVDDLPDNVRTFLQSRFGFSGSIQSKASDGSFTRTNVSLYTDGCNFNVGMSMDNVDLSVLILDGNTDDPELFIINKTSKKYRKLSAVDMAFLGIDADTLLAGLNISSSSGEIKIHKENITENGVEYVVYKSTNGKNITSIYTFDGEITKVQTNDESGNLLSVIEINEFYMELPDDIFSYSQYTKTLSLMEVII